MRTKLVVVPLLVVLLVSMVSPLLVQGAVANYSVVGQIGGVTNSVVLSGGQLYFNVGPRIVRLAVPTGTPGSPTLPGTYGGILPGIPLDVKVANGFVYAAMGRDGVAVVDASTLQPVGRVLLPATGHAAAIAVGPQRLYVAAGNDGVVSYNLGSDKKTLTFSAVLAFTDPVRNVTDVEIRTDGGSTFLYAAANNYAPALVDRGGVLMFDVTTSPNPGVPLGDAAGIDINALAVSAAVVYAAGDDMFYALEAGDLDLIGSVALASPAVQLAIRPTAGFVYLSSAAGIDVVNVTNLAAPAVATASPLVTSGFAMGLDASEFVGSSSTYVYVADSAAGLSIVTSPLATPQNLTLASQSYVKPKPSVATLVAGANQQGFPFSVDTLWTVAGAAPSQLNIVGAGIVPVSPVRSLTTYNNLLLASADLAGLLRYQINPGAEPTSLGAFVTGGTAYASAVAWPNAVVADGANGLTVVNINGAMSLVGNRPVPDVLTSSFELVDTKGVFAYVYDNDTDGHVRIYDLTTAGSPLPRGWITQTGVLDLKVSGNYAFLACGSAGIRVLNISNPDAPVFVGGADYATAGSAEKLVIYNSSLVIAERAAGVEVAAIAPAGTLSSVARFDTSGRALGLALVPGNNLYVADQDGGLVAIQSSLFGVNWSFLPLVVR